MFKNYIFDFGNVIVNFDTYYMTSLYVDTPEDIRLVESVLFDRLYWDRLDLGTISDTQLKEAACSRLPERLHQKAMQVYDNWHKNLPFTPKIVDLIDEIKQRGGKLFLLSNISTGFAQNYEQSPCLAELFSRFDGLVFSAPLGIVKPQPEIFEFLLDKYSLSASDTVFIDDSQKNILGAQNVGLSTFLFNGNVSKLREFLFK